MLLQCLFVGLVTCYSVCDKTSYPYAGRSVSVPLVPSATKAITIGGSSVPVTVNGTITVIDGCTFQAVDLVLTGPASAQFYGGFIGDTNGVTLSPVVITASPNKQTITFPFVTNPGASVSYTDFNEFRLFDPSTNSLIAVAALPSGVVSPSSANSRPTGSALPSLPSPTLQAQQPSQTLASNGALALELPLYLVALLSLLQ